MPGSFPFPLYTGLLEPEHYKKIGSAIWLFLWCVGSTTKEIESEEGGSWGIVLGNKPVKREELAAQFGVAERTVQRWVDILERHGYIRITRAPYGMVISVKKSKKFIRRSDKRLLDGPPERSDMSHLPDRTVRTNKGITKDIEAVAVEVESIRHIQDIESHFLKRRGKGFAVSPSDYAEIRRMISEGVPVSLIKTCIDRSFDEYRPRHARDEIRSVAFCIPRIYDEWEKLLTSKAMTGPVSRTPIALGTPGRMRNQQQLDELDKLIQEEEERRGTR